MRRLHAGRRVETPVCRWIKPLNNSERSSLLSWGLFGRVSAPRRIRIRSNLFDPSDGLCWKPFAIRRILLNYFEWQMHYKWSNYTSFPQCTNQVALNHNEKWRWLRTWNRTTTKPKWEHLTTVTYLNHWTTVGNDNCYMFHVTWTVVRRSIRIFSTDESTSHSSIYSNQRLFYKQRVVGPCSSMRRVREEIVIQGQEEKENSKLYDKAGACSVIDISLHPTGPASSVTNSLIDRTPKSKCASVLCSYISLSVRVNLWWCSSNADNNNELQLSRVDSSIWQTDSPPQFTPFETL